MASREEQKVMFIVRYKDPLNMTQTREKFIEFVEKNGVIDLELKSSLDSPRGFFAKVSLVSMKKLFGGEYFLDTRWNSNCWCAVPEKPRKPSNLDSYTLQLGKRPVPDELKEYVDSIDLTYTFTKDEVDEEICKKFDL